jgi:hypothetical protein
MPSSAAELRAKLARLDQVKQATLAEDTRHFLELDPGARLLATLRHCDAHIEAFGTGPGEEAGAESEAETWARVRRRLAGHP